MIPNEEKNTRSPPCSGNPTNPCGMRKQQRETIETLNDKGYDFINKSNLGAWGNFMQYLRDTDQSKRFYEELAELDDDEERILAMQDAFEIWMDTGEL